MSEPNDPNDEEEGDRRLANIVLAVGFVVLVGSGIWLANAMVTREESRRLPRIRTTQLLSGRRAGAAAIVRNAT